MDDDDLQHRTEKKVHDYLKKEEKPPSAHEKKKIRYRRKLGRMRFLYGGLCGFLSTFYTQPMMLIKTRMQMSAPRMAVSHRLSTLEVVGKIYQNEGFLGFYKGVSCYVLRTIFYTSFRFGIFSYMYNSCKDRPSFTQKVYFGSLSGAVAGFSTLPAEVAFIKMTADRALPWDRRKHYAHVFNAINSIFKQHGPIALFRGAVPTTIKGMLVNAASLGVYTEVKEKYYGKLKPQISTEKWRKRKVKRMVYLQASTVCGVLTAIVSAPIDLVKTRIQAQYGVFGTHQYTSLSGTLVKIVHEEGFWSLWKGFTPYSLYIIPHTVFVVFMFEEFDYKFRHMRLMH